jgi:quercetin dioxygenase-like cupin family protein
VTAEMTHIPDLATLVSVDTEATVSRTVLKAEGVRLVLFSFDAGQELSEHTAAVPVLLQVLDGRLTVSSGGQTVELQPGGVVHLPTRAPHSVVAAEPSRMLLTMLDPRAE